MGTNETMEIIVNIVCNFYSLTREEIMTRSRQQIYTYPRFMAFKLLQDYGYGSKLIEYRFGFDHSTVINGIQKMEDLIMTSPRFKMEYKNILKNIPLFDNYEKPLSAKEQYDRCIALLEELGIDSGEFILKYESLGLNRRKNFVYKEMSILERKKIDKDKENIIIENNAIIA